MFENFCHSPSITISFTFFCREFFLGVLPTLHGNFRNVLEYDVNFQYRKCISIYSHHPCGRYTCISARLAQSVEHETLNLGVVGSSPTLGEFILSAYRESPEGSMSLALVLLNYAKITPRQHGFYHAA